MLQAARVILALGCEYTGAIGLLWHAVEDIIYVEGQEGGEST